MISPEMFPQKLAMAATSIGESDLLDTGMSLRDLLADEFFPQRAIKPRPANRELIALRRLSQVFAECPESVQQELVNAAVEFCGADSAGISLEEPENGTFRWVVVAGSFSKYLGGTTPRNYSPCGTCLDLGRPQLYTLHQPYYDHLGVTAAPIIDGILIPWSNPFMRGTLWAVSHSSDEAFNANDYEFLSSLADFASIILRHQHQQSVVQESERARGVAEMANMLAHRINNPLQSLTNTLFLARHGADHKVEEYLAQAEADLQILSKQVAALLDVSSRYKPRAAQPPLGFDDGKTTYYAAALLHATLPQAQMMPSDSEVDQQTHNE